MEKKLFFVFDNQDTEVTCTLEQLKDLVEAECDPRNFKTEDATDGYQWTITPKWMTDEEFNNIPEAY